MTCSHVVLGATTRWVWEAGLNAFSIWFLEICLGHFHPNHRSDYGACEGLDLLHTWQNRLFQPIRFLPDVLQEQLSTKSLNWYIGTGGNCHCTWEKKKAISIGLEAQLIAHCDRFSLRWKIMAVEMNVLLLRLIWCAGPIRFLRETRCSKGIDFSTCRAVSPSFKMIFVDGNINTRFVIDFSTYLIRSREIVLKRLHFTIRLSVRYRVS